MHLNNGCSGQSSIFHLTSGIIESIIYIIEELGVKMLNILYSTCVFLFELYFSTCVTESFLFARYGAMMGHYSNNNLIYAVERTKVIVKNHFNDISLYINNSLSVSAFPISRKFGQRCH